MQSEQGISDFIMLHPPYHNIITYSGKVWGEPHSVDLSRCESYDDFIEKLNFAIKKLFLSLRKDGRLAVLVGDIRKNGRFRSIQKDMMSVYAPQFMRTKASSSKPAKVPTGSNMKPSETI